MSLKNTPPTFITTQLQGDYYDHLCDLLEDNGTPLKPQDCIGVGTFAVNLAMIEECLESLTEDGYIVSSQSRGSTVSKANPAAALYKEAQSAVKFWASEFHMTPKSRGNVLTPLGFGAKGDDKGDGFEEV